MPQHPLRRRPQQPHPGVLAHQTQATVFARRYNFSAITSKWGCGDDYVYGYADMLKALQNPDEDDDDDEREEYLNWMGREFDPEFFDLHELQNRVDDFQRVIGEARWGFYHR